MLTVTTLNMNGIRSAARKGLAEWVAQARPDCMCVQELKAQAPDIEGELTSLAEMPGYFHFAQKKGYSGVGVFTRHVPSDVLVGIGVPEFDDEGRWVELRFDTPQRKWSLVSCYFPSGSASEERQQSKFRFLDVMLPHLQILAKSREVLVCADVNIAHHPIDLKNWKGNLKNSGFLPEERAWMDRLLADGRWQDVYRQLYPEASEACYTWWSNRGQARANNVGWRIDYHLATADIAKTAQTASIYKEAWFSDHAPLTVTYDWAI